jgi:hypothetical protein
MIVLTPEACNLLAIPLGSTIIGLDNFCSVIMSSLVHLCPHPRDSCSLCTKSKFVRLFLASSFHWLLLFRFTCSALFAI